MAQLLTNLLGDIHWRSQHNLADLVITGLSSDSRAIEPGMVFVALAGIQADGHRYIGEAAARGCVAVVVEAGHDVAAYGSLPIITVDDSRLALGKMAAAFNGNPAAGMVMIGITGTNGKTTTTYLLEAVIREAGGNPGVIGTINYRFNGQEFPAPFTTPEAVLLQGLLHEMAAGGVTHVIMEVSSHALSQQRLAGVEFEAALFTNLSRDHLDFHGSMEVYFKAKMGLFKQLKPHGAGVVVIEAANAADHAWGRRLVSELTAVGGRVISCGLAADADVSASQIDYSISGTTALLDIMGRTLPIRSELAGEFNLKNIVGAAAVAAALKFEPDDIGRGLSRAVRAPGRLERVRCRAAQAQKDPGPAVFVDYAHTPDALENVLLTLRQLTSGRLLVVFGCGGDRDRGKRFVMGQVAGRLAAVVIITSDNSRSESTELIMAEIERGVQDTGHKNYIAIASRTEAIAWAIKTAATDDVVLIAGKGHETYQIDRQGRTFFDDRQEALKQLNVVK